MNMLFPLDSIYTHTHTHTHTTTTNQTRDAQTTQDLVLWIQECHLVGKRDVHYFDIRC